GLRVNCSSACRQVVHVSTWASTAAASAPASPSASHLPRSADEGQRVKVKAPDRPQGARHSPRISQPAKEKPDTPRPICFRRALMAGARSSSPGTQRSPGRGPRNGVADQGPQRLSAWCSGGPTNVLVAAVYSPGSASRRVVEACLCGELMAVL